MFIKVLAIIYKSTLKLTGKFLKIGYRMYSFLFKRTKENSLIGDASNDNIKFQKNGYVGSSCRK